MALLVTAFFCVFTVQAASASTPGPAWEVSSVAHPTNFSMGDNAKCAQKSGSLCDQYLITLTNVGSEPSGGPVTIVDTLPRGLKPVKAYDAYAETEEKGSCVLAAGTATCTYGGTVMPGATVAVFVEVEVVEVGGKLPVGEITNAVKVSGGGAPPVSTGLPLTQPNTVGGPPTVFGLSAFGFAAHDVSGALDTQAGDHPYGLTTTVNLNTMLTNHPHENIPFAFASVEPPKDIVFYLPLGALGDPLATPPCTEQQLVPFVIECPASRVGQVMLFINESVTSSTDAGSTASSLYNMAPEAGFPAQLAFRAESTIVVPLYASVVHTPSGYMVRVAAPGIPRTVRAEGAMITLFGDPRTANGEPGNSSAFFTNPMDCSASPLTARVQVDSWAHPGRWVSGESVAYPQVTGCDLLQFQPTVEMRSEVTQAEAPSGYRIDIKVPQNPNRFPVLATPLLKNVKLTLPAGMMISPGGGNGLEGCQATGPEGIGMPTGDATPTEAGEGEAIGPDAMTHLTPGHCPEQSQVGTVEIETPILPAHSLTGHLYLAQPTCGGEGQPACTPASASNGELYGLYLEAQGSSEGHSDGVVIKLKGTAAVNPTTGQVTATFDENPQFPLSEVKIDLKGGPRAPLANPAACGEAGANADLTPWSSPVTPDALLSTGFRVDWDGHGAPCPATMPFAPVLTAGSTSPHAGGFGAFTLTATRGDRQQDLSRVQVRMPPGLLGMLSSVPLCSEPQASQGACGESSRIGTMSVAVGSGAQPLWVQGRVYLTGPYGGAPFGLSIVVPAVAGPFNLGNVVVRSRIDVDPSTAQATITSDPLPQFKDGVPLRIQQLNVTVDRPGFIFNPTNCTAKQVQASFESAQGTVASPASPFAVEGCKTLPFKPSFKVATAGKTSKANGASLTVKVTSTTGQANIAKVDLQLPKQLPARLTTLQKACTEAQFNTNPAGCPAGSVIGYAKAITPVLSVPLTGPAYLVSHGGAAFPDVQFILQGEGVRIDLDGKTQIKHGITYSHFETVPDAPISSFETVLPQGPHSALGTNIPVKAKNSLCGQKLTIPTTLTGQNGVVVKQSTKVGVTGCPPTRATIKKARRARKSNRKAARR